MKNEVLAECPFFLLQHLPQSLESTELYKQANRLDPGCPLTEPLIKGCWLTGREVAVASLDICRRCRIAFTHFKPRTQGH